MKTPSSPNPSSITEDQLFSWFCQLSQMHGQLAAEQLETVVRNKLGGVLLAFGPALVMLTAMRTAKRPHLFPDAPATGEALAQRQRTATAWLTLRNRLRQMAKLADDGYLSAQAYATGPTWSFISKALAQQHPQEIATADIPLRNLALVPAFLMLHAYYQARKQSKARNKAAALAATSPAPTEGAPPSRTLPRRRSEAAFHRDRAARIFQDLLLSRRRGEKPSPTR